MGWMNTLYRTYEANAAMAGKTDEEFPLSVIAHMLANAQIEITITKDGEFKGAISLEKGMGKTLIPVTEASASRANIIAPHALCDMLPYAAGDFSNYSDDKKAEEKFKQYSVQLEKWANSEYTDEKINAVFRYISKKTMIADLLSALQIEIDENGKLANKKIGGSPYEKALVRFRVMGTSPDAVWEDARLFDLYTNYYLSFREGKQDICYINGKCGAVTTNHPKGIIASNYGAKLISANDTSNFTYRGRFVTSEQACAVSYEASQKAHSALTWLAANQGVVFGSKYKRTYICWNPNGKKIFQPLKDSISNEMEDDGDIVPNTEPHYKEKLRDTLSGYKNDISDNADIVVIALDAATTGRLSVVYYNELKASDFYNRIEKWYENCIWYFTKFTPEKKPYEVVSVPSLKQIVNCAFGNEEESFLKTDDKVFKEQFQRIFHCMIDDMPIPKVIIHYLFCRASNRLAYSESNYNRILATACAVIRKSHNEINKGEEIKMELDLKNNDRSYLFGRILAIAEYVERRTYDKGEERTPNAVRFQAAFVQHPFTIWKRLKDVLIPYYEKLGVRTADYFENMVGEITAMLDESDQNKLNNPLGEEYLLGYYLQRREFYKKKTEDNDIKQNTNNTEEE